MSIRIAVFSGIFFLILFLSAEILLRIGLTFYGYPFLRPGDYLYTGFYPNLEEVIKTDIRNDDDIQDVLILGGSVISKPWSNMGYRLDTILQKKYGQGKKFAFYNIAAAGHTSLDNLIKYRLLKDERFDLVIYYEAINENRANSIPKEDFRADYSHMKWYSDLYMLQAHPEMNVTVIPFIMDMAFKALKDRVTKKKYISMDNVDQVYSVLGADIKTAASYKQNLSDIADLAAARGDQMLFTTYASYFPDSVKLTGEQSDMKYFAGCIYASPVNIWGKADNVKKGIAAHNQIMKELMASRKLPYLDMEAIMPKKGSLFCDVCHVSEPGATLFAENMASYIIKNHLLEGHQRQFTSKP